MNTIFEYLSWRGDLSMEQSPFSEVDGLILSCLSYHFLDEVLEYYDTTPISLAELAYLIRELPQEKLRMRDPRDVVLLQLLGKCRRFQDVQICLHVNHVDRELVAQFSAITLLLEDGSIFVAYRGTDMSLVGWKEDFHMTFRECIPAQIGAAAYLLHVSKKFDGNIRVGGHSKGGNLAVFAASIAPPALQERLIKIYTFDGPGFHQGMLQFSGYQTILEKLESYIPESSIIGLILQQEGSHFVVQSSEKGLFQHDPYSWGIVANHFICLEDVSTGSRLVDKTLKSFLGHLTIQKREIFVNTLFELLDQTHTDEEGEVVLSTHNAFKTLQTLSDEDEETRQVIGEGIGLLWKAARKTAEEYGSTFHKKAEIKKMKR
ncbi:Mbeg1-like protein [Chakrabartyella piscis]|uniref:Mbeg1-like protein n=1 Tax=Chakrabartyella piscis TaxID=2918914 RepID=UPI00295846DF|nr:Mbeg1-like protein [Chakrabartyella piscis]